MATGLANAKDLRAKRTRRLSQETLLGLMREKNYGAITVQDIAERSTLHRTTFYAHFEDKYDLLDSVARERIQRALADAIPDNALLTRDTLHACCRTVFAYLAELQDGCPSRDRSLDPMFQTAVQEVLNGFVAGRLVVSSAAGTARVGILASAVSWAIFGAASQWSRGARAEPADWMAAQLVAVLTEGIGGALVTS